MHGVQYIAAGAGIIFTDAQGHAYTLRVTGSSSSAYLEFLKDNDKSFFAFDYTTQRIILANAPSADMNPATKAYADTKLPLTGGTLAGALTLPGAPTAALHAATKAYTDTKLSSAGGQVSGIFEFSASNGFTFTDNQEHVYTMRTTGNSDGANLSIFKGTNVANSFVSFDYASQRLLLGAGPSADMNPASKKYVDDQINTCVGNTGVQSIAGSALIINNTDSGATNAYLHLKHNGDSGFQLGYTDDILRFRSMSSSVNGIEIDKSGNVSIHNGTTSSAANCYVDSSTGTLKRSTSSRRYKDNIVYLDEDESVEIVKKLQPAEFTQKGDESGRKFVGYIAEDVDPVDKRLCDYITENNEEVPDSVEYGRFDALLTMAVQKLLREVDELKQKNSELEARVTALEEAGV